MDKTHIRSLSSNDQRSQPFANSADSPYVKKKYLNNVPDRNEYARLNKLLTQNVNFKTERSTKASSKSPTFDIQPSSRQKYETTEINGRQLLISHITNSEKGEPLIEVNQTSRGKKGGIIDLTIPAHLIHPKVVNYNNTEASLLYMGENTLDSNTEDNEGINNKKDNDTTKEYEHQTDLVLGEINTEISEPVMPSTPMKYEKKRVLSKSPHRYTTQVPLYPTEVRDNFDRSTRNLQNNNRSNNTPYENASNATDRGKNIVIVKFNENPQVQNVLNLLQKGISFNIKKKRSDAQLDYLRSLLQNNVTSCVESFPQTLRRGILKKPNSMFQKKIPNIKRNLKTNLLLETRYSPRTSHSPNFHDVYDIADSDRVGDITSKQFREKLQLDRSSHASKSPIATTRRSVNKSNVSPHNITGHYNKTLCHNASSKTVRELSSNKNEILNKNPKFKPIKNLISVTSNCNNLTPIPVKKESICKISSHDFIAAERAAVLIRRIEYSLNMKKKMKKDPIKNYVHLKLEAKSILIQRWWRRCRVVKKKKEKAAILIQKHVLRFLLSTSWQFLRRNKNCVFPFIVTLNYVLDKKRLKDAFLILYFNYAKLSQANFVCERVCKIQTRMKKFQKWKTTTKVRNYQRRISTSEDKLCSLIIKADQNYSQHALKDVMTKWLNISQKHNELRQNSRNVLRENIITPYFKHIQLQHFTDFKKKLKRSKQFVTLLSTGLKSLRRFSIEMIRNYANKKILDEMRIIQLVDLFKCQTYRTVRFYFNKWRTVSNQLRENEKTSKIFCGQVLNKGSTTQLLLNLFHIVSCLRNKILKEKFILMRSFPRKEENISGEKIILHSESSENAKIITFCRKGLIQKRQIRNLTLLIKQCHQHSLKESFNFFKTKINKLDGQLKLKNISQKFVRITKNFLRRKFDLLRSKIQIIKNADLIGHFCQKGLLRKQKCHIMTNLLINTNRIHLNMIKIAFDKLRKTNITNQNALTSTTIEQLELKRIPTQADPLSNMLNIVALKHSQLLLNRFRQFISRCETEGNVRAIGRFCRQGLNKCRLKQKLLFLVNKQSKLNNDLLERAFIRYYTTCQMIRSGETINKFCRKGLIRTKRKKIVISLINKLSNTRLIFIRDKFNQLRSLSKLITSAKTIALFCKKGLQHKYRNNILTAFINKINNNKIDQLKKYFELLRLNNKLEKNAKVIAKFCHKGLKFKQQLKQNQITDTLKKLVNSVERKYVNDLKDKLIHLDTICRSVKNADIISTFCKKGLVYRKQARLLKLFKQLDSSNCSVVKSKFNFLRTYNTISKNADLIAIFCRRGLKKRRDVKLTNLFNSLDAKLKKFTRFMFEQLKCITTECRKDEMKMVSKHFCGNVLKKITRTEILKQIFKALNCNYTDTLRLKFKQFQRCTAFGEGIGLERIRSSFNKEGVRENVYKRKTFGELRSSRYVDFGSDNLNAQKDKKSSDKVNNVKMKKDFTITITITEEQLADTKSFFDYHGVNFEKLTQLHSKTVIIQKLFRGLRQRILFKKLKQLI